MLKDPLALSLTLLFSKSRKGEEQKYSEFNVDSKISRFSWQSACSNFFPNSASQNLQSCSPTCWGTLLKTWHSTACSQVGTSSLLSSWELPTVNGIPPEPLEKMRARLWALPALMPILYLTWSFQFLSVARSRIELSDFTGDFWEV